MAEISTSTIMITGVLTGFAVGIGAETAKYLIERYIRHKYDRLFGKIDEGVKTYKDYMKDVLPFETKKEPKTKDR